MIMNEKQLQDNIIYLLKKYIPNRKDLEILIKEDSGCVKYILAEIDVHKEIEYMDEDIDLIQDIAYYYL